MLKNWFNYRPSIAELAKQYNRESITQVLNEYPNLSGVGLSLGEAMGGMTSENRQKWINETFIKGVQAANRPAKLIHRVPFSAGLVNGGSTSLITEQINAELTSVSITACKGFAPLL